MGKIKIIVTKVPERKEDCPFFKGYPDYRCSAGGNCTSYESECPNCEKLISFDDYLHRVSEKEFEDAIDK